MDRAALAALGQELVRRGMHAHAAQLRAFWRGRGDWTEEHVVALAKALDVPPFQGAYETRTWNAGCSQCPTTVWRVHTVLTFSGGVIVECATCGETWRERDPA